jgi:hypothetical protein
MKTGRGEADPTGEVGGVSFGRDWGVGWRKCNPILHYVALLRDTLAAGSKWCRPGTTCLPNRRKSSQKKSITHETDLSVYILCRSMPIGNDPCLLIDIIFRCGSDFGFDAFCSDPLFNALPQGRGSWSKTIGNPERERPATARRCRALFLANGVP